MVRMLCLLSSVCVRVCLCVFVCVCVFVCFVGFTIGLRYPSYTAQEPGLMHLAMY